MTYSIDIAIFHSLESYLDTIFTVQFSHSSRSDSAVRQIGLGSAWLGTGFFQGEQHLAFAPLFQQTHLKELHFITRATKSSQPSSSDSDSRY